MTNYPAFKREMDRQHKRLLQVLEILENIQHSPEAHDEALSEALHVMSEHALKHFKYEEAAMVDASYPGLAQHRQAHKAFLKKVTGLCVDKTFGQAVAAAEVIKFLRHWFDHHHDTEDRFMEQYLGDQSGSGGDKQTP